jgi:large subunit ribosomal protein L9
MKVIFLKDVPRVGRKYDVKDVADGFAQNNLIPRKLAVAATPAAVARIEAEKAALRGAKEKTEEQVARLKDATAKEPLLIAARANPKGGLFEGVGPAQIASAIEKTLGIALAAEHIDLAHPLKEVGTHVVKVKVGSAKGECTVMIEAK